MRLLILLPLIVSSSAFAETPDRTGSPYFAVDQPGREGTLPLAEISADVRISGVIARVQVTQVYRNEGTDPIEARYVFPASTRAAIFGLRMRIGSRTIIAKIAERGEAAADYEHAKQEGRTSSLLEEERPNVFQMKVANILPGDR